MSKSLKKMQLVNDQIGKKMGVKQKMAIREDLSNSKRGFFIRAQIASFIRFAELAVFQ